MELLIKTEMVSLRPQCLQCLHPLHLKEEQKPVPLREVGMISCGKCEAKYATVGGVPYLGTLSTEYFESLLELSAIGANVFQNKFDQADLEKDYRLYIQILDALAAGQTQDQVRENFGLKEFPTWLTNRLNETLQFQTVANGLDFQKKSVLDVGAGTGFDSLRFLLKGAEVTCLEFNPVQAALGHQKIKSLSWFGGSGYQIPFPAESFDFVVANAAMHHLLDIPVAFQEMLRVLKVGGSILTFADSFRSNETSDYQEAQIFNGHAAVMGGVNERVPRISEFTQIPARYANSLSGFAFAYVYDRQGKLFPRQLDLKSLGQLDDVNGTICFRIQKTKQINIAPARQKGKAIPVEKISAKLVKEESFIEELLASAPERVFNLPLFAKQQAKVQLLNGFRLPEEGLHYRRTNGQARLFFEGELDNKSVFLNYSIPFDGRHQTGHLQIFFNDTLIQEVPTESGFRYSRTLPIEGGASGKRLAVSLRLKGFDSCEMFMYQAELRSTVTSTPDSTVPEESNASLISLRSQKQKIAVVIPQEAPFEDTRAFFEHVARLGIDLDVHLHDQELYFYQNLSPKIRLKSSLDLLKVGEMLEPLGITPVYFSWPQKNFSLQANSIDAPRIFWTVDTKGVVVKKTAHLQEIVPTPAKVPMRRKVKSVLKILKNRYLD